MRQRADLYDQTLPTVTTRASTDFGTGHFPYKGERSATWIGLETPDTCEPLTSNKLLGTPAELLSYRSASRNKSSLWCSQTLHCSIAKGRRVRQWTHGHTISYSVQCEQLFVVE